MHRIAALALDLLLVTCFAALGRRSHAEGLDVAGIAHTAWPFLAGAVAGHGAVLIARRAAPTLPAGVMVWLCALVGGMLLRRLTGEGTAWPFVLVAAVVLGVLLLGWRLLRSALDRRRRAYRHPRSVIRTERPGTPSV